MDGEEELTSSTGTRPEATLTHCRFYDQDEKDEAIEEIDFLIK